MDVKLNAYTILGRAVEEGISLGCGPAERYGNDPDSKAWEDDITSAVMQALDAIVDFRPEVAAGLVFKTRTIVEEAIQTGVRRGLMHAYKHTDTPSPSAIVQHLEMDIMNSLCEVLEFGD